MFAKERQEKIQELLNRNNAVSSMDLVQMFQVSMETIRRDLLEMENEGLLSRVHGGAVKREEMKRYHKLPLRNQEYSEQKRALSVKAMEFISEGDIIAVDAGSTAIAFAEALKEYFTHLTVVTHSLDVFQIVSEKQGFNVILCGGSFFREENAFCGPLTLETLKMLHISKAFVFPSAISLKHGVGDYQQEIYQIQKQMIKSADQVFFLADSSKFEKSALLKIDDVKSDYIFITDDGLLPELEKLYQQNKIPIYRKGAEK